LHLSGSQQGQFAELTLASERGVIGAADADGQRAKTKFL
jgi:hypothetical protein